MAADESNQVCMENELMLSALVKEEKSWKLKVSSLQKRLDHSKQAHDEMMKERDEAATQCAIAQAKVRVMMIPCGVDMCLYQ